MERLFGASEVGMDGRGAVGEVLAQQGSGRIDEHEREDREVNREKQQGKPGTPAFGLLGRHRCGRKKCRGGKRGGCDRSFHLLQWLAPPPLSGRPSTRSASSAASAWPICSSSRSAVLSSLSIRAPAASSDARASAFADSIIRAASASTLRLSSSRLAKASRRVASSRCSRNSSADRASLSSCSVRSLRLLNRFSRSASRFRNGRKNSRLNINQKTRKETIRTAKVPQLGGMCISANGSSQVFLIQRLAARGRSHRAGFFCTPPRGCRDGHHGCGGLDPESS